MNKEKDISELTVKELFQRLKPKEFYSILTILIAIITSAFAFGYKVNDLTGKNETNNPEEFDVKKLENVFQKHSSAQVKLATAEEIKLFQNFHEKVAKEQWNEAYNLLSDNWKTKLSNDPLNLRYEYRMTRKYDFEYYIPEVFSGNEAQFLAIFEYTDDVPVFDKIDDILDQPIISVLSKADSLTFMSEIKNQLSKNFETSNINENEIDNAILTKIKSISVGNMRNKKNTLLESIGKELGAKPIFPNYISMNDITREFKNMAISDVKVIKTDEGWRLDESHTLIKGN